MTRILLVRPNFPLSRETADAWRSAGDVRFLRRGREAERLPRIAERHDVVLNLGRSDLPDDVPMVNPPDVVAASVSPIETREVLSGGLMPPETMTPPLWLKGPGGRGGSNKRFIPDGTDDEVIVPDGWITEEHIGGDEYRVNVVNERVVQVHQRFGTNGDRSYRWVGVRNAPGGIIPAAKDVVRRIRERMGDADLVLALDMTKRHTDGRVLTFEFNTCPGMNEPTASRVVAQLAREEG